MDKAVRLSCRAAVAGAAITIVAVLINSITVYGGALDATTAQSAAFLAANLMSTAGAVLLLYGLPGVFARWHEGWGRIGLASLALISLAVMIIAFTALLDAIVVPWLAAKAPDLLKDANPPLFTAIYLTLVVALFAGTILMAIQILRRRVGPRWVGFLAIASAVMYPVYIWASSSPHNVLVTLVGSLSPILLLIAVGYLGYLGASDSQTVRAEPMNRAAQGV